MRVKSAKSIRLPGRWNRRNSLTSQQVSRLRGASGPTHSSASSAFRSGSANPPTVREVLHHDGVVPARQIRPAPIIDPPQTGLVLEANSEGRPSHRNRMPYRVRRWTRHQSRRSNSQSRPDRHPDRDPLARTSVPPSIKLESQMTLAIPAGIAIESQFILGASRMARQERSRRRGLSRRRDERERSSIASTRLLRWPGAGARRQTRRAATEDSHGHRPNPES